MTKKSTTTMDPTCVELVRAGLITYKQLNEVHRLVQETGGTFEDVLVSRGYVKKEQLAGRRPRVAKRKALRLNYSLDLVKTGLITFKQLNECHREARASKGQKTVVDVMIGRGYVTDVQLATLPKPAERNKHKKFSSSWDLFRAGAVSLKALNECHRHVKMDAPGKSLKEALLEKGVITKEQLAEVERKKAAGALDEKGPVRSPFMEKYAKELQGIPEDLRDTLRREHLAVEGITPEQDEAGAAEADFDSDGETVEMQSAKTFLGVDEEAADDEEEEAAADDEGDGRADLMAAKTFMDLSEGPEPEEGDDDDDEGSPDRAELQAARTMMGGDDDSDENAVDIQGAKTFIGDVEEDDAPDPDFQAQKTMAGADDDEGSVDFRAAKTFMGANEEEEAPVETGADSDPEIRGAKTFMDAGEATGSKPDIDLRGGNTFMDVGGDEPIPEPKKRVEAPNAGSTFMDMELEQAGAGMFGASETGSGVGPGIMSEGSDPTSSKFGKSGFQRQDTNTGLERDGATFMDLEGNDAAGGAGGDSKAAALREAFDRANRSASGASGTEFDAKAGKSSAGGKTASKTDIGGKSGASTVAPGTSSAGISGAGTSTAGASGASATSHGTSSAGTSGSETGSKGSSTSGQGGSATEADTEEAKKKKKKKKEDEDAYKHPLVGKIIGGCRIVKKLGEGGMGAVFLAEHTKLKRQSVIKVVPAHLSQNRQLIARFEREARAAAIVQHVNIVQVYNVGEENGVHYIEMEYVDGQALDGILKDRKVIEQMECVRIIKEACRGLAEAHKGGIIHRDIKPDNIMMTRKGVVKIADFGLARAGSEDLELTKVGQILGTPAYMSPEQCQGKPTDHRADIYSLGATFYAMITGKRPFTGESVMAIMQKHIDEEPISPREYNPDIAVQVVKIILKMMAKKPDDRFQSSEEVIAAIDQFMKEEGTEHLQEVQKALGTDYRIQKKLGQGGMGAVYSARCQVDNKQRVKKDELVAIKVLNREVTQEEVNRFEQEAKLALEIDHENIIRVLEYSISKENNYDLNYIVMEFVEGTSVRDIIRDKKKLEPKEATRILREVGKGLGRAHELGIIHRDIKPDNIMIAKTGAVKIADFGIAKHTEGQSELTQAGVVVGTPHYMSPEQCVGASRGVKITTQADIYSLGATLYFMVTGQKPFEGDTQMTIILQHLNQPPKPPKEIDPALDESLSNIVLNMMAKKPKYRYVTVAEVVRDIDAAEKGKRIKKRRNIDVSFEETGRAKWVVAAAAGFVILVVGAAYFASGDKKGQLARQLTQEMDTRVAKAEKQVNGELGTKKFAVLGDLVTNTDLGIKSLDKDLAKSFEPRIAALSAKVKAARDERDERARNYKAQMLALLAKAKEEYAAVGKLGDEDGQTLRTSEHCLASYGEVFALAIDANDEAFGDSSLCQESIDLRSDMTRDLNTLGGKRLEKNRDVIVAKFEPNKYWVEAVQQLDGFMRIWAAVSVPRHEAKVPLEFGGKKLFDKYKDLEATELKGDLRTMSVAAYEADQVEQAEMARAKASNGFPDYKLLVASYRSAKAAIEKLNTADQFSSIHKKFVDGRLALLAGERNALADQKLKEAKDAALAFATALKPRSTGQVLDDALNGIRKAFEADDAKFKSCKEELDDARKSAFKQLLQNWRGLQSELDRRAWKDRKFLAVAADYQKYVTDPEYLEPIDDAGKSITIREEARRAVEDELHFNLDLLQKFNPSGDTRNQGSMVRVEASDFEVGTDDTSNPFTNQRPKRAVTAAEVPTFYIDRTEVTIAQYVRFLRTDPRTGRPYENAEAMKPDQLFFCHEHDPNESPFCDPAEPRTPNGHMPPGIFLEQAPQKPVSNASWYDALAFAKWAGKRLPTEVEWEKAAVWDPTLKQHHSYPWGDQFEASRVVCSGANDEWPDLPAVGSKDAGASFYGALDMAGSVWEWCADWYGPYKGAKTADLDPDYGDKYRVLRGGSFQDSRESAFRGGFRFRGSPVERKPNVGFRCVRAE